MIPEHLRFGGGATETMFHPLMALWMLIAVVLIAICPRNKVIVPFLLAFFTIPVAQVVVLGGFHFTAPRILILAGLVRWALFNGSSSGSKGRFPGGFSGIDWVVVLWSLSAVIILCLTFPEKQAFINALGVLLDTLGGYLVVRFLIPDGEAIRRAFKTLAAICVIQGVPMIVEQVIHINVFGPMAGLPLESVMREGRVRAGGSLGFLIAGPMAGVLIPMFVWLWKAGRSRIAACAGIAGATAMVITSNSSTSLLAFAGGLLGLAFWPLRAWMRQIRWGLAIGLVGLHLVMKAPVWALIARIDLTGSSSSYQRYGLVDMTIRNFRDWWLMGTTRYVSWGWDSWDLTNQFVAVAMTGGLLTLIFYVAIFKRGFGAVGAARKLVNGDRKQEWFLWCLGSTLFATLVTHFGINYMAVLIMSFFPLVASISVAAFEARQAAAALTAESPSPVPAPGAARGFLPLGKAKSGALLRGPSTRPREGSTSWIKA